MADEPSRSMPQRFFRACLLFLAGVVALWLALELLAQFWGWLLLLAAVAVVVYGAVFGYQYWRDRRWRA